MKNLKQNVKVLVTHIFYQMPTVLGKFRNGIDYKNSFETHKEYIGLHLT